MTRELELSHARASHSRKETEAQRSYLKTVLEHLSSGVLGVSDEGILRTVNRSAERILDAPLSRFVGQHLSEVRRNYPSLTPLVDPITRHVRDHLRDWREEIVIERGSERRLLLLRGVELSTAEGGTPGYIAVFDDLTLLNQAQRDAAWAEVARRLAHEVKNPLTPIQLAAERLRRRFMGRLAQEDTEVLDRATHTIVSQVEALKTLVNAFGDYARPPQFDLRPILVHTLIAEVLDLYENDQRLSITRDFVKTDPTLRADSGRLRQLLHNLIKNSLEAVGDHTKPHLEVKTRYVEVESKTWLELSIADNGPGLPQNFGDRWYEPYTTSKPKGTGLGLAVAKKIAEEHGGSLRGDNRPGGGAIFILLLPL